MARKRTQWGPEVEARIVALMSRGGTATSISTALAAAGVKGASRATVARRMQELAGRVKAEKAERVKARRASAKAEPAAPVHVAPVVEERPPLPATPEAIPDDADPSTLKWWLEKAEELARQAEAEGDLDAFGKMGRLASTLLEHRRKAEPPPKADPNEHPDVVALAAAAREMLHKMIDQVVTR